MTTKADYAPEEWELLLKPLFLVGLAVAEAADSGSVGSVMEYGAILMGAMEARKQYASNTLLAALLTDAQVKGLGRQPGRQKNTSTPGQQQKDDLLAACRGAISLLARKALSQEAAEYRYTVLLIGSHVANAAKEGGGILGAGGQRLSAAEASILKEISEALGIS